MECARPASLPGYRRWWDECHLDTSNKEKNYGELDALFRHFAITFLSTRWLETSSPLKKTVKIASHLIGPNCSQFVFKRSVLKQCSSRYVVFNYVALSVNLLNAANGKLENNEQCCTPYKLQVKSYTENFSLLRTIRSHNKQFRFPKNKVVLQVPLKTLPKNW